MKSIDLKYVTEKVRPTFNFAKVVVDIIIKVTNIAIIINKDFIVIIVIIIVVIAVRWVKLQRNVKKIFNLMGYFPLYGKNLNFIII